MVYETSYESGRSPFRPDTTRGNWAAPGDFIYASLGLAFKLDFISLSWLYFAEMGISACVPYLICLALYVVPIMVMQSFMGQFSSSGFISAFRLSPIHKSMGYISLFLNFAILTYYSVFVAIPLLFLINSFRPTVPWSCEGNNYASLNITYNNDKNLCHITNPTDVEKDDNNTVASYSTTRYHTPAEIFIGSQFNKTYFTREYYNDGTISWQLIGFTLLTWIIIAAIFHYFFHTEKLGKLLRYSVWGTLLALVICLIRFSFLPGAVEGIQEFFTPSSNHMLEGFVVIPLHVMSAFGSGWGTLLTLASFNKFKTNIMRYNWVIALGQMFIFLAFSLMACLLKRHVTDIIDEHEKDNYYTMKHEWMLFMYSAQAISTMELPNMWYILYYGMLSAAGIILLLIQIHSLLTSVFDEFEKLRAHKTKVTHAFIATLALCSLYFCSSDGFTNFISLSIDSVIFQIGLNLLLLLVVLWIYGRVRFQRDIEFMLGQPFPTWKVYLLRFIAPLCLIFTLLEILAIGIFHHLHSIWILHVAMLIFFILPWFFIPAYCIYSLMQTTGSCCLRYKRCYRPTDWYPMDMDDRQRYEEAMGNFDITHQLQEVVPDMEPETF